MYSCCQIMMVLYSTRNAFILIIVEGSLKMRNKKHIYTFQHYLHKNFICSFLPSSQYKFMCFSMDDLGHTTRRQNDIISSSLVLKMKCCCYISGYNLVYLLLTDLESSPETSWVSHSWLQPHSNPIKRNF